MTWWLLIPAAVVTMAVLVLGWALCRVAAWSDEAARRQWEERRGADGS